MLERARAAITAPHVSFIEHDVRKPWPIGSEAVDMVLANLVLEHVARLEPIFGEAARVLKPGGLFYVSELHPYRQLRGGGARFTTKGGEARVESFLHTTSDFCGAALEAGFVLTDLSEPTDAEPGEEEEVHLPRLLRLIFAKPGPAAPSGAE